MRRKKEFPAGRALILRIALDSSETNVNEYSKTACHTRDLYHENFYNCFSIVVNMCKMDKIKYFKTEYKVKHFTIDVFKKNSQQALH